MKNIKTGKILLYNPVTGKHESVDALVGESAYEAAVRLGYTTLSEAEWLSEYEVKRDDAISAIIEKGNETLDSIPDDYQTLDTHVTQLATAMPQTHNEYKSHMFLEQADIDATLTEQGKLADAKIVGDKINELTQEIADATASYTVESSNLYKESQVSQGKVADFTNGSISENVYYNMTPMYKVEPGKKIYISGYVKYYGTRRMTNVARSVVIYDNQKAFLSGDGDNGTCYQYINDSGTTVYVRFNIYTPLFTEEQSELFGGTDIYISIVDANEAIAAMTYEPYGRNFNDAGFLKTAEQSLTQAEKDQVQRNIGALTEEKIGTLFSGFTHRTKNLYNPDNLVKGKYCDASTGAMVDYATMDVYSVLVPAGYTAYCTCRLNGATERSAKYATRRNAVFNAAGTTFISGNNSDATSYRHTNSTDADQTVVFTIWGDGSAYIVDDFMIELFAPEQTPYISDYEPYGFMPSSDYPPYIDAPLHEPRAYFANEVDDTVQTILPHLSNVNLCFGFVTDTHILPNDEENVRCTMDTFSNLKAVCERVPLDGLIHGGDLLMHGWDCTTQDDSNVYANKTRAYMLQANQKVYMTEGNHDGINGAPPAEGSLYGAIMSHNESYVVREGNSSSFYADFAKQKIRLIMPNTIEPNGRHGLTNGVYEWLKATLESVPNGYNVIIASHIGIQSADFETNKSETAALLNSWHDHTGDYASNTGKIIVWIAGHQHYDWVVPSSSSGVHFPVVVCTCSARLYSTPSSDAANAGAVNVNTRTLRSVLQDSWSVFVYRPDEGKIHLVRFGAGDDRTIDYANWDTTK